MSRRVPITTHRHLRAAAAVALALAVALAGAMSAAGAARAAATLSFDKACYVITKRVPMMHITGSGYVPHSHVLLTSTANVDASVTANAAGAISAAVRAPAPHFARPSIKKVTFTAQDEGARPAVGATGIARVTPMGALHGSTPRAPGLKALTETTNWTFSGFAPGQTIYGHYILDGRQVALTAFGTAHGDCGKLDTRAPLFPATPHHASYPVQFDSAATYSPRTTPKITGRVSLNLSF